MNFSARRATDFRRAVDYVLHDKDSDTDDRVQAVQYLNLATDDPACEMQITVDAAKAIQKRQRRQDGKRDQGSGGTTDRPVYTFNLSWHPLDSPTPQHILATGRAALKALGLEQHQAVMAIHRDRPHPHLHVVVSLLHPTTGRVASVRNDHHILDRFSYSYESSQEMIRSFKRAARIERLPVNPRRQAALEKAKVIKTERKAAGKALAQKHQAAREQRKQEFQQAHNEFKDKKQQIYDRYKPLFDEIWRSNGPTIKKDFQPRRSLFAQKKEWMQLARALKPADWVGPRIRHAFRQADKAYVPHGTPNITSRVFKWSRDAQTKDDLRPLQRGAPQLRGGRVIQPGRPWLTRRERSAQLKLDRNAELVDLSLKHQRRVEELEKSDISAQKDNDQEWRDFKAESVKIWKQHKEEFSAPDQQKAGRGLGGEAKETEKTPVRKEFNEHNPKGSNSTVLKTDMTVEQYAEDYIAGKGRDDPVYQQFAANNAPAIEKEFQARKERPSETEAISQFTDFLQDQAGFEIRDPVIMDGEWRNVPVRGQKTGKSGAYRGFFDNGKIQGFTINHKDGVRHKWEPDGEHERITPEQRAKYEREHAENTARRNAQIQARQDDAAKHAKLIWDQCRPASSDHKYLQTKGVHPHGIRQCRDDLTMPSADPNKPDIRLRGALIVPRYDIQGRLRSFQAIMGNGTKFYQTHGQKSGASFILGHVTPESTICIAEGYSTAATILECTGLPVAVAFDAGNLKNVALALREKFPTHHIALCADNDRHLPEQSKPNTGIEKAQEAAEAVNGEVLIPQFPEGTAPDKTDFNDLFTLAGAEAVKCYFPSADHAPSNDGPEHDFGGFER